MTAKQSRRVPKWLLIVFGLCLVVGIIGAIANPGSDNSAPAAAAPTRTTAPTAPPTKVPVASPTVQPPEATVEVSPTEPLLLPTEPPAATPGPVTIRDSNLRAGPGRDFPAIGSVPAGQALAVVATNPAGDWYQLSSGEWIAAQQIANPPTGLPIAADIPPAPTALPARSAPAIAAPTAQPLPYAGGSSCDCSSNLYNCADFVAWDAQSCFLRCMELVGRDIHGLDGDNDGSACEWEY